MRHNPFTYRFALGIMSLALLSCASIDRQQATTAVPTRTDMQHFTLDNGLNVYLMPRAQKGIEMRLLVKSGSLQENEQQRGLAHFTEHMAFKGTLHFPGTSGFKQLEQQGIKLGNHVNAVTSFNSTTYKLSLPQATPEQTATGLQLLSDWAQGITFDQDAFEKERGVIVEEWRVRQGVGFRINQALEQLRYHGSRYAERDPIGLLDVVRHAPVDEAKAYYRTWYHPERMALVIVGELDQSTIKSTITRYFSAKPSQPATPDNPEWQRFAPQPALLVSPIFDREYGDRVIQFSLQRDAVAPLNTSAGQRDDLLDNLWIPILNQRLAVLVDNGELPSASVNEQGALLDEKRRQQLMIVRPSGQDYQGALRLLWTEVQRMATSPVSDDELNGVRQRLLAKLSQQAATQQRYQNDYLADQITTALAFQMPLFDKKQQLFMTHALIKDVKPADLQRHVAGILSSASPRLALIGPDGDSATFQPQAFTSLWQQIRSTQPGPFAQQARAVELNLPTPIAGHVSERQTLPLDNTEQWTLSNRINVIVKSDKTLQDDVQLSLRIPGGRSLETESTPGLVEWALKLPESSGYGTYSSRELALFGKQHSITLQPYSELLYHGYRGSAPADELETLLKLLYLKITQPQFNGQKLEQYKASFASSLSKMPVERQFLDNINRESYLHGDRLTISPEGNWRQFTAYQLQQSHQQLLGATQDMTLVIAGAVDVQKVKASVERWIAALPATDQRLHWRDVGIRPKMSTLTKTYPIASSDKSMISIQFAAPAQWSPQEVVALQLLDTIVSQRLRFALREQASGIYALGFSSMLAKLPAPYYTGRLNFTTAPERAEEMTRLTQAVIASLRQQGVTEKELKEAKNIWRTEKQPAWQSASFWADTLAQTAADDKNFARLDQELAIWNRLTVADINRAAARYLGQNEKIFMLTPP